MPNGGLNQIKGNEDAQEDTPNLDESLIKGKDKQEPEWVEELLPEESDEAAEEQSEETEEKGEKIAKVILDRGGEGVSPEAPESGAVDMPEGPTDQDPEMWKEPEDVENPNISEVEKPNS